MRVVVGSAGEKPDFGLQLNWKAAEARKSGDNCHAKLIALDYRANYTLQPLLVTVAPKTALRMTHRWWFEV